MQVAINRREYHFASSAYDSAFGSLPSADPHKVVFFYVVDSAIELIDKPLQLREETLRYLSKFEPSSWFDDPVCTVSARHR